MGRAHSILREQRTRAIYRKHILSYRHSSLTHTLSLTHPPVAHGLLERRHMQGLGTCGPSLPNESVSHVMICSIHSIECSAFIAYRVLKPYKYIHSLQSTLPTQALPLLAAHENNLLCIAARARGPTTAQTAIHPDTDLYHCGSGQRCSKQHRRGLHQKTLDGSRQFEGNARAVIGQRRVGCERPLARGT